MSVRSMVGGGVQERWRVPLTDSPISPDTLPGGPFIILIIHRTVHNHYTVMRSERAPLDTLQDNPSDIKYQMKH